jgi:hypothetical protein
MKRLLVLLMVFAGVAEAQLIPRTVVTIVGALPQDSLNTRVAIADTVDGRGGNYITPTQFKADTTYKKNQLATKLGKADSTGEAGASYMTQTMRKTDSTYRAAQDVAIRAAQAADSTYKTAQIALKQNTLVSDTASFTTSATRLAVYVVGTTGTSIFSVNIRGQADVLPVADDLCRYQPKTDSLVVTRVAGTTSGLQISWTKLK